VTQYFDKHEDGNTTRGGKPKQEEVKKRQARLYVPRIMAETMLATTGNSTSIHFGMGHLC
jgi:hypothetical protein